MKQTQKTLALWLMIILLGMVILHFVQQKPATVRQVSFSEFMDAINADNVESVTIQNDNYHGVFKKTYQEGAAFQTMGPASSEKVLTALSDHKVKTEFKPAEDPSFWQHLLISWLPLLLLFGLFFFSMRQLQMGGGKAMSFGRSKARLLVQNEKKVTFEDVAGIDEAREELEEIISFLKDPKKFTRLGGRIPKGVLLMGSPGTGKTLLARAIAGEANAPFFSISGSDFVEMFVGVGASRVRDMFEQGRKNAPCLIFIDEIDAVGRSRFSGIGGGHDEREQTLNALLVEMDGFDTQEGVILIAATNRPDVLDTALLRPGRFDRQIVIDLPDLNGREQILKVHVQKVKLAEDVDLSVLARGTPGFSGADLANLINEAALLAARNHKKGIEMVELEEARDKVRFGRERRSRVMDEKDKEITAYHEAGHAIVTSLLEHTEPVHKVTIIPRGNAYLGATMHLPLKDRYTYGRKKVFDELTVYMGGRIAEEMVFGEITSGAYGDIKGATRLTRKMVCEWGMSDKLGFVEYGEKEEPLFVGREITHSHQFSEATAVAIDQEVRRIIDECYNRARTILQENRDKLIEMAKALLEYETLDGEHVKEIIKYGKLLNPPRKMPPPVLLERTPTLAPGTGEAKESAKSVPPPGTVPSPAV